MGFPEKGVGVRGQVQVSGFRFQVSGYDDTGAISSAKVRERKKKA
jgi:hypothetical protein